MTPTRLLLPRTLALAALLVAAVPQPAAIAADSWDSIEKLPGQTPVPVNVDGNERLYFRVRREQPLPVTIEGPGRLRITSRVEFVGVEAKLVSYTLRVYDGARELEHEETETAPSSVVSHGKAAVGKSRRMTVDIPAGHHDLRIVAEGVPAVLVRLHQSAPKGGEQPTVSLTPVNAWRSVLVSEGEKTIPYYSVSAGHPIRVNVVGPTSRSVISRLDFDDSMRGT